jgi:hypothetical protein
MKIPGSASCNIIPVAIMLSIPHLHSPELVRYAIPFRRPTPCHVQKLQLRYGRFHKLRTGIKNGYYNIHSFEYKIQNLFFKSEILILNLQCIG